MVDNAAHISDSPDTLVPDPQVWREFGISSMTGWRWTRDPTLGFPPPIKIRTRCFRSRRALEEFKRRMVARGAAA
jgi:predicted DNA-binding transcriptional regulator AlpA